MHAIIDDRDLVECFDLIHDLYLSAPPGAPAAATLPTITESRDTLRLYLKIDDPNLRTALRMLMRALAAPATCAGPIGPRRSAASRRA